MQENKQEQNIGHIERIPLKERNDFQIFLFGKKMEAKHGVYDRSIDWFDKAKLISEIIDDADREDHEELKRYIMEKKYNDASEIVMKAINEVQKNTIYH